MTTDPYPGYPGPVQWPGPIDVDVDLGAGHQTVAGAGPVPTASAAPDAGDVAGTR